MALRRQGYRHVGWDVIGEDWEPSRGGQVVARDVLSATRIVGDGAVIVLHTWPTSSADALPEIIEGLRADDTTFVAVSDLGDRDLGATRNPQLVSENPG
jgi:peptidoglycan/xylan/chitin deacetylase (PgdA/CDA1 family)